MKISANRNAPNQIIAVGVFLDDAWLDVSQAPPMDYHVVTCSTNGGIKFDRNYGRGDYALQKARLDCLNIAIENRYRLRLLPNLTKSFFAADPSFIKNIQPVIGTDDLSISFYNVGLSSLSLKGNRRFKSVESLSNIMDKINHHVSGIKELPEVRSVFPKEQNIIHLR